MAKKSTFSSLQGQLLISMQTEPGEFFHQSVVLLTAHTKDYAEGLVINHPLPVSIRRNILDQMDLRLDINTMYQGGPIDLTHGSILHTVEYQTKDTEFITDDIALTQTQQILQDIAINHPPKKFLFCVGHAAWKANQLEEELMGNIWIPVLANASILFDTPNEKKWQSALATLKIDATRLSMVAGKA